MISYDPINNEEEQYLIEEYKKRVSRILEAVKIKYTSEILHKFVLNDFPDMRTLVQKSQSFYRREIKELDPKNFNINFDFKDLFDVCLLDPDPVTNYKFIINEYSSKIDDTMRVLGRDFIEYLKNNAPNKIDKIPLIIIAVAEHQYQINFVIDKIITLLSLVYKIQLILSQQK
jgi:hypothetical protein